MKARIGYFLIVLSAISFISVTTWVAVATIYSHWMLLLAIVSMVIAIIGILGISEGRRPE